MNTHKFLNNIVLIFFLIFSVEIFATADSKLMHMKVDLSDQKSL